VTERDELAHELAMARWEQQVTAQRRWTRVGTTLTTAARDRRRALDLPRDLLRVLRDPATAPPRPIAPWEDDEARERSRALVERAEQLIEPEQQDERAELLHRAVEADATSGHALTLLNEQLIRAGRPAEARDATRTMQRFHNSPGQRRRVRAAEGAVRELDPSWYPPIPGHPEAIEPVSPTRVLHLLKGSVPHQVAGATTRSMYTLRAQAAVGLDPVAMTQLQFPRTMGVDSFDNPELVHDIRHHRLDAGPGLDLRSVPNDAELTMWAALAHKVVLAERPAILHAASGARGYENAVVAHSLGRHHDLPVVYEVRSFHEATWTANHWLAERAPIYHLRIERENECMRRAEAVVTLGNSMRDDLIERGIPPEKITVVPNAVDAAHFRAEGKDEQLAAEIGVAGRTVLGYISNLSRREGVDILLEGIARLRGRGYDVAGVVCGDGPELEGLRRQAVELGIADIVHLPGPVDHADIKRYYELIDVFVVPRRDDRAARHVTPIKPFEAMALERAVVVSDLPALCEIVDPPSRGRMFRAGDAADLADVVAPLVESPELRRSLGHAARRWVEAERTWDANALRYRELYDDILERRSSR
jgi:glycosyltransferase involved in cell wall biosynthesis